MFSGFSAIAKWQRRLYYENCGTFSSLKCVHVNHKVLVVIVRPKINRHKCNCHGTLWESLILWALWSRSLPIKIIYWTLTKTARIKLENNKNTHTERERYTHEAFVCNTLSLTFFSYYIIIIIRMKWTQFYFVFWVV